MLVFYVLICTFFSRERHRLLAVEQIAEAEAETPLTE